MGNPIPCTSKYGHDRLRQDGGDDSGRDAALVHRRQRQLHGHVPDRHARRDAGLLPGRRRQLHARGASARPPPSGRPTTAAAIRRDGPARCTTSASPARSATGSRSTRARRTRSTSWATTTSGCSSTGGWRSISAASTRRSVQLAVTTARSAGRRQRANSFGMTNGNVYEVVVFQAERQKTSSSYQLTLSGFNGATSACGPTCGDRVVTPPEQCDNGTANNTGGYNKCTRRLQAGAVLRRHAWSPTPRLRQRPQRRRLRRDDRLRPRLQAARALRRPARADRIRRAVRRRHQQRRATAAARRSASAPATAATARCRARRSSATTAPTTAPTATAATRAMPLPNCQFGPRCGDGVVQDAVRRAVRADGANDPDCTAACRQPGHLRRRRRRRAPEQCDYGAVDNNGEYGGCAPGCILAPRLRRRRQERAGRLRRRRQRQQLRRLLAAVQAGPPLRRRHDQPALRAVRRRREQRPDGHLLDGLQVQHPVAAAPP